jgi:HD superfamily phosphohydrolase
MILPTNTAEMKAIRKSGNSKTGSRRTRNARFAGRATTPVGAARLVATGARRGECLYNVILSLGIDYQRLDLIVRDSEMVVERDRATRK